MSESSRARPRRLRRDSTQASIASNVRRIAAELEATILRQGLTIKEVEKQLDWESGVLSQQLTGPLELLTVYQVLALLKVEPSAFFAEVFQ